jgi:hypothetical protein
VSSLGLSTSLKRRCAARPSRPAAYPLVRTTLLLATALAVVGEVLVPTAPPRLSDIGSVDTVSGGHVDLDKGVVRSLYALIVGVTSLAMRATWLRASPVSPIRPSCCS